MDLHNCTATEISELIKSKSVSAMDVALSVVKRYKDLQDSLKAWVYFDEEIFLKQASDADQSIGTYVR